MFRTRSLVAGIVAVTASGAIGGFAASSTTGAGAATSTPAGVVVVNPGRVLDTRNTGKLGVGGRLVVNTGIAGATAVAVNITLTDTDGAGYVTAGNGAGTPPTASIINSYGPAQTVANYALVPVDLAGHFTMLTSNGANLLVDLMGYLPASGTPTPSGLTATITGYGPGSTITSVTGTVTNGSGVAKNLRVDIKCPNGTVETDSFFSLGAGQTKGFSVLCDQAFTSGATVQAVLEI